MTRFCILLAAAALAGCAAAPPARDLPAYTCRAASQELKIDGDLSDPAWKDAPLTPPFALPFGSSLKTPGTRMKILHDDCALYFAFECYDADIWCTFADRDDPVHLEEAIGLYVDPLGDGRDFYGFCINANNALLDLKRPSGAGVGTNKWLEYVRWNAEGVEHAVKVQGTINSRNDTDTGWTLELKIPFDALEARPKPGDVWRLQAGRYEMPRYGGLLVPTWSETTIMFDPRNFGKLIFTE